MKRLLLRIWPLVIITFILILFTNYSIDPANLYNSRYAEEISDCLIGGKNITNVVNFDERQLQKDWINKMNSKPDIVVLGSSRSMLINSESFPGSKFINNSVSGASLEDYLAILNCYDEKGILPDSIILNIDPYLLNRNNGQFRWKSVAENYYTFLGKLKLDSIYSKYSCTLTEFEYNYDKLYEFLGFAYFQQSFVTFMKDGGKTRLIPTYNKENETFTKLSDGSISYESKVVNRDTFQIENEAFRVINNKPIFSLGDFEELDKEYCLIFEELINYLKNKDIAVIFFYSPYHPIVYDQLKRDNDYRMFFAAEKYYNEIGKKYNVINLGAFNPALNGLFSKDFYDGLHASRSTIKKVILKSN